MSQALSRELHFVFRSGFLMPSSPAADGLRCHPASGSSLFAKQVDNGNKLASKCPSAPSSYNNLFMNGKEVFKFAVRTVPQVPPAFL